MYIVVDFINTTLHAITIWFQNANVKNTFSINDISILYGFNRNTLHWGEYFPLCNAVSLLYGVFTENKNCGARKTAVAT
jgi:hypothetical protein